MIDVESFFQVDTAKGASPILDQVQRVALSLAGDPALLCAQSVVVPYGWLLGPRRRKSLAPSPSVATSSRYT